MFTGIIETVGTVTDILSNGSNKTFWVESTLSSSFVVDQSVAHNGVCLTVEEIRENRHRVTAIEETLEKTDLDTWKVGIPVNIERSLKVGDRLDGHFVQGHVDATATCTGKADMDGSWEFDFEFPKKFAKLLIEKGSICINGISLTAYNVGKKKFSVAIVPYTYEHTGIRFIQPGDKVNIEFDVLGKYLMRSISLKANN
jgi:riboflavin synthase